MRNNQPVRHICTAEDHQTAQDRASQSCGDLVDALATIQNKTGAWPCWSTGSNCRKRRRCRRDFS